MPHSSSTILVTGLTPPPTIYSAIGSGSAEKIARSTSGSGSAEKISRSRTGSGSAENMSRSETGSGSPAKIARSATGSGSAEKIAAFEKNSGGGNKDRDGRSRMGSNPAPDLCVKGRVEGGGTRACVGRSFCSVDGVCAQVASEEDAAFAYVLDRSSARLSFLLPALFSPLPTLQLRVLATYLDPTLSVGPSYAARVSVPRVSFSNLSQICHTTTARMYVLCVSGLLYLCLSHPR
ncbi:hypothetical protein K438DRAFT_1970704 [Mycena galopus ATCC 62051]|nr:hypothetical protein K438DRAFT_1970704 [Mycena galopus ATCC 62051]